MAFGRMRNNKRPSSSSSSSYASTIATVVFIAFCVLGVWMLTSNNLMSPQATTRTSSGLRPDETRETNDIINPIESTATLKLNEKGSTGTFDDNPGDLPEDAIKTDESQKLDQVSSGKDYSKEANVGASYQQQSAERQEEVSENEGKLKENESQIDENPHGLGGKESIEEPQRHIEQQVQVSEESTLNQKENIQEITDTRRKGPENDHDQVEEGKDGLRGQENDNDQSSEQGRQQQQDENQQQIAEEQQKNKQQAAEDQQLQQEQQQQTDNPITFSDETKKDPTKQDTNEDTNTRLDKDDGNQEERSISRQKEETSKLVDSEQEGDTAIINTQVNKQDTSAASADDKTNDSNSLPNSGIPKESNESTRSWATQAAQSRNEKERRKDKVEGQDEESLYGYTWKLCNATAGPDYIPCLDNEKALKALRSTKHFEHRERHCPEDPPTCLVPLPQGYKKPVQWPQSRDKIWFHNVPHPELAQVKGHQNWVKVSGEFLTFPGGGTQFIHGALHYIEFIEKMVPGIKWGKHTRVVLDVGCGVASFGGYLFEKDVLTMSFAPKDEHEAQVQFALERGIPAISAVMGSKRLPFPSGVFDIVHCARCRVPWHAEGGRLLLELNRVLRPGGFFVWSATPVYQKLEEDVEIWEAMSKLTASMCWRLDKKEKDALNKIGAAVFRKPINNACYDKRKENNPPMCKSDDDPNAAWYVPLESCMHRVPTEVTARGSKWPLRWAARLQTPPYWLNKTQMGIYGKPAPDDFVKDYEHWQNVVNKSYINGLGISWSNVRNVMDMRAVYGGFAAALRNFKVWVVNVVNVNSPDTLPIIYERGLFGIYHDWCESFSTYPRTYDLLHADHLFSKLRERCKLDPVMAEIDRIVRPGGNLIVRDDSSAIGEVENLLKSLHWEVHLTFSKDQEGILSATKSDWRPTSYASS
ncbi:putative methyltransferase PMT27 [Silene latifolia]|uniref:putative methyltransferase PMT27 n=1 Tax=Silene latifolia TaxID=37657 RepID=UPI003D773D6A